ncbi:hypothetical protein ACW73L_19335 [Methylolobus aquaticus]
MAFANNLTGGPVSRARKENLAEHPRDVGDHPNGFDGSSLSFIDTSRVYFSSFYLHGFSELADSGKIRLRVINRIPAALRAAVQDPEWQHLLFAMCLFEYRQGGRTRYFCIDAHDGNRLDRTAPNGGYHWPLLQAVDAYFKVNLNAGVIAETPELAAHRGKIWSVPQFFPVNPPMIAALARRILLPTTWFGFRPGMAHDQAYGGHRADALRRFRDFANFPAIDAMLKRRTDQKDIDIFFVTSFYAKPRHRAMMERRYQIMQRIGRCNDLNCVVGFTSTESVPEPFSDALSPRLTLEQYIATVARARVTVYTQGMERCISSKFAIAMALGSALVGEPLGNDAALLEPHASLSELLSTEEPDAIAQRAIALARDPARAREIGAANARIFDAELSPRASAARMLGLVSRL